MSGWIDLLTESTAINMLAGTGPCFVQGGY